MGKLPFIEYTSINTSSYLIPLKLYKGPKARIFTPFYWKEMKTKEVNNFSLFALVLKHNRK